MSKPLAVSCALALLLSGCSSTRGSSTVDSEPGLYPDLGTWTRPIGASSPEAQRWFDQGLVLSYAFNHDEAIRCFHEAARLDPTNPMPWWGIALASGPNINAPMTDSGAAMPLRAIAEARRLSDRVTPLERDLIEALAARYSADASVTRAALDSAFARAMGDLADRYGTDPDVLTLGFRLVSRVKGFSFAEHHLDFSAEKPEGLLDRVLEELLALDRRLHVELFLSEERNRDIARACDELIAEITGKGLGAPRGK